VECVLNVSYCDHTPAVFVSTLVLNVTDGRTDRQTDGPRTTCNLITAVMLSSHDRDGR